MTVHSGGKEVLEAWTATLANNEFHEPWRWCEADVDESRTPAVRRKADGSVQGCTKYGSRPWSEPGLGEGRAMQPLRIRASYGCNCPFHHPGSLAAWQPGGMRVRATR